MIRPRRSGGKPPPEAVYAAGKRKQRATNAIKLLDELLLTDLEGHPDIIKARDVIKGYRKSFDEL